MSKKLKYILSGCFLLIGMLVFAPAPKAEAYGLTQTAIAKNAVTVKWDADEDALNYKVYVGADYSHLKLYKTVSSKVTSITITGLPAGCEKYVKVTYDWKSYSGEVYKNYTAGSDYVKTLPGQVTGLRQERWYYWIKSFDAVWTKQGAADGYEYIVKTSDGKKKASGKTTWNDLSVDKVSNAKIYTVQVRAYTTFNGKKYYGAWSAKGYFFTQPQVKKAKVSKKKLTVKWAKVSGATGYDIYVSTKKTSGYKKVKSVNSKKSSATIKKIGKKKIANKKKYYVYVVTKKKVGKKTYNSGRLYYWNTKDTSDGYF